MSTYKQSRVAILEKQGGVLSWHEDLEAGFREHGATVASIQLRTSTWTEYQVKWRTHTPSFHNPEIVARVARELKTFRPDLVVVLKHAGLPHATNDAWRSVIGPNVPVIGWVCDHVTNWPQNNAPCLDAVYYFDSASRPLLETVYSDRTVRLQHLPLAASPTRYQACSIPFTKRRPCLVFAGKNTRARKKQISAYRTAGGKIDCFGPYAATSWRLWRRRNLSPSTLASLYTKYFSVLNLLQTPNTVNGLNLRAFEIPAAGGLATYPQVPDLESAFIPGEEVIAYHDIVDLKNQIDDLLAKPERAAEIALAGRARLLREHTFSHRARRLLDEWLN